MGFRWRHGRRSRPRLLRQARSRSPHPTTLNDWQPGLPGVVTEVAGSSRLAARLRELGVIPGRPIRVLRSGTPLIVEVDGSRFGMRPQDAAAVRVRPRAGAADFPAAPI